jgi:FkbM family methyltransferase
MPRKLLRSLLRSLGYDGMSRDRFDRLRIAEQVAPSHQRILHDYFSLYAAQTDRIHLLHLGANDGVKDDFTAFMRNHPKVESALVEPQLHCLEPLRRLQTLNPRLRVLPCAFGDKDASATLYRFAIEEEKNIQLNVFSSFERDMVEDKKRYFSLQAEIIAETVDACTLPTLLQRAGFPQADILISDIEGFDHAVVCQALALKPLPVIFIFEQRWLSASVRSRCYEMLDHHGYGVLHGDQDALCFRLRPADPADRNHP